MCLSVCLRVCPSVCLSVCPSARPPVRPSVRPTVHLFIKVFYFSSELDTDDEVRDRATFYRSVLEAKEKVLNSAYILNGMIGSLFTNYYEGCHAKISPCRAKI